MHRWDGVGSEVLVVGAASGEVAGVGLPEGSNLVVEEPSRGVIEPSPACKRVNGPEAKGLP